jgi:predicted Zn finger-like uncharacterized protein
LIVRCPNCGTEFGFDDRQVGEGVTVRCSVCKHVFKVVANAAAGAPTAAWQIRTTDNASFMANDVATLREWISEGRLTPDDEVSRTGRNWVRLGEMAEFDDLFRGQTGAVGPVGVVKPVASPKPSQSVSVVQPLSKVQPPAPPARPTVTPAAKPSSADSLTAGPTPQSQRPTMSPPRSAPAQSKAPVAPPPVEEDDDDDGVLIDDSQDDFEPSPHKGRSRSASSPVRRRDDDDGEHRMASAPIEPDDSIEAPRRSGGLGVVAVVAVLLLGGVGVVFGVPQIRERVLGSSNGDGVADTPVGPTGQATARPEIAAAEAATQSLGTAALAQAEAKLQRAIDAGDADAATQAAMKVALAELLLNRALAYQIAGAIDQTRRDDFRSRANDDREDGERLIDGLEGFSDVDRLAKVRALVRLAAGRAEVEVAPLVPASASETKLIVRGAVLWQDDAAAVPEGLVAGLQSLPQHTGLSQSTLALALLRAGDTTAARNTAERLMVAVGSDEQVVAQAIRAHLGPEQGPQPDAVDTAGETAGPGDEGGTVAKPPPPPDEDGGGGDDDGGGGGGGGGNSFERLIDRGCEQVANGDADAGIKTLQRAFNINPRDVDVLVCLADGYAAQGSNHHANQFYERALEQSPTNKGALRGAAKAAAKTGATQKAIDLYERLLKVDPNNAVALAYLANNKPGGAQPSDSGSEPPPEGGG